MRDFCVGNRPLPDGSVVPKLNKSYVDALKKLTPKESIEKFQAEPAGMTEIMRGHPMFETVMGRINIDPRILIGATYVSPMGYSYEVLALSQITVQGGRCIPSILAIKTWNGTSCEKHYNLPALVSHMRGGKALLRIPSGHGLLGPI